MVTTVKVEHIPNCDGCDAQGHPPKLGVWDAPTRRTSIFGGSWGNFCAQCLEMFAVPNSSIMTKREYRCICGEDNGHDGYDACRQGCSDRCKACN